MKLLHIAPDEKFIDSIYWQFNTVFKNQNEFIIFSDKVNQTKPRYVTLNRGFTTIQKNKKGLNFCLKKVKEYDLVVFHGLNYFQSQIVLKSSSINNFIWFFWGGELYDNPKAYKFKVLGQETKRTFFKKTFKNKTKELIRPAFYRIKYNTKTPELTIISAAKKIKYFGIIHKEDVEFFKDKNYLNKDIVHITMTYYPLEFIFKGIENIKTQGNNILLGNSASLSNNHLEAFELLKPFKIKERKLVVPLSYGDKEYAQSICKVGSSIFGENFDPLLNFMPLDTYNTIISHCNIVIMNHYRQQSVGNIIAMLWMGAKIYLDERNTFYHYLKRIGVFVFSINKDFNINNQEALVGLSESKIDLNRQLLKANIGFDTIKKKLYKNLTAIVNEH